MNRRMRFCAGVLAMILVSCEQGNKPADKLINPEIEGLVADSVQTLAVNDFHVNVTQQGEITDGVWKTSSAENFVIFRAGLWIALEHNGAFYANLVQEGQLPYSNFTSVWNGKRVGVFLVTGETDIPAVDWPSDYGAPVTSTGAPLVYGDAMGWAAFTSDTTVASSSLLAQPIPGLRVTEAVFGYKRSDLSSVVFIRYDLKNRGAESLAGIYVGFFADTDLAPSLERTGYDSTRSLTYTYVDSVGAALESYVTGFTFLETPEHVGTLSHRIVRKNDYVDPDFGEIGFTSPQQVVYALQGLSNSGLPMVNPITGGATRFAFTGDPITRTGWLDVRIDVRSLISSGPFALSPGETVTLTLAWVVNAGADLGQALTALQSKVDQIRAEANIWQFP